MVEAWRNVIVQAFRDKTVKVFDSYLVREVLIKGTVQLDVEEEYVEKKGRNRYVLIPLQFTGTVTPLPRQYNNDPVRFLCDAIETKADIREELDMQWGKLLQRYISLEASTKEVAFYYNVKKTRWEIAFRITEFEEQNVFPVE